MSNKDDVRRGKDNTIYRKDGSVILEPKALHVDDEQWMVENNVRQPLVSIDRECFRKDDFDKKRLIDAKATEGKIKIVNGGIVSPSIYKEKKKAFYDSRMTTEDKRKQKVKKVYREIIRNNTRIKATQ